MARFVWLSGLLVVLVACGDDSGLQDAAAPTGEAGTPDAGCGAACADSGSGLARCPRHADEASCAADTACYVLTGFELDAAEGCTRRKYTGCEWNQTGCAAVVTVLERDGVCWKIPGCVPGDWQTLPEGDCSYDDFDGVEMCGAREPDAGNDTDAGVGSDSGAQTVSCDHRSVACFLSVPVCPTGQVASVSGACFGPCVDVENCSCNEAADCPDPSQYTCHLSAGHCGPYVN